MSTMAGETSHKRGLSSIELHASGPIRLTIDEDRLADGRKLKSDPNAGCSGADVEQNCIDSRRWTARRTCSYDLIGVGGRYRVPERAALSLPGYGHKSI